MGSSLAPSFLVSMPQLADPNFSRTVVLLCKHSDEGAFGLVVNRPMVTNGRLVINLDPPVTTDHDLQVWIGGPVEPESSWILLGEEAGDVGGSEKTSSSDKAGLQHGVHIADGLYLSTDPNLLRRLLDPTPPPHARLIVGYSGWRRGQLEEELEASAWLMSD